MKAMETCRMLSWASIRPPGAQQRQPLLRDPSPDRILPITTLSPRTRPADGNEGAAKDTHTTRPVHRGQMLPTGDLLRSHLLCAQRRAAA